jgi:hypothetical protein
MEFSADDYSKTFAVFERPFKCTCCCLGRPEMRGSIANGVPLGRLYEPCTCCDPQFEIYNSKDEQKYMVTADCCQCGYCCRGTTCGKCSETVFAIHNAQKSSPTVENKDGVIKRVFSGAIQELVSDADNFEIVFPVDATPEDKLMLIGTTLMIDYRFFEDNGGNQQGHHHHY